MRRPKFTLKTLLWLMAVVAAFGAGVQWDRKTASDDRESLRSNLLHCREEYGKLFETLLRFQAVLDRHDIDESEIETVDLHQ
jgi:hypothetical protein